MNRPLADHGAAPGERRALIEAVVASTVGTTIEWYDFFLYGLLAADVFPRLFFPELDAHAALLASLSTYTVGFLARPLGGIIFGHLGDKVGRKSTLVATLLLMGISTLLIGLLPTYHQVGVTAAVVLVLLRFTQGLGVGGEWGGAVLLALEYGHRGRRGFYASWPQAGVPLGLLLAAGAVGLLRWGLGAEAFEAWGWRVPFFLSGLLIVVGMLIRTRVLETPLFRQLQQENRVAATPLAETLRLHWRLVLLTAGTRVSENASFYLFTVYIIVYAKNVLAIDTGLAYLAIYAGAAVEFLLIPLYGLLSDRLSRKRMYLLGSLFLIGFAWPYYALLETRDVVWIVTATVAMLGLGHAVLYSVQAALIPELFETHVRYTGASLGYQLAAPFAGGLAPIIAATLMVRFPGTYWPLVAYLVLISILSLGCVQLLAETSRRDIT